MDLIYKLEEILECPICLGTYEKPICLDCGHVICKMCVENLQISARDNCSRTFMCPFCRKKSSNRVKRPWNECVVLQELVKYTEKLKRAKKEQEYDIDFDELPDEFLNSLGKI